MTKGEKGMEYVLVGIFGIILLICSVQDVKTREISVVTPVVLAAVGIGYEIMRNNFLPSVGRSAVIFGILMLISFFSKESLGYGDVAVISACSVVLGVVGTVLMLSVTLMLSTVGVLAKMCKGRLKEGKKVLSVPLIPYITVGFLLSAFGVMI